MPPDVPDIFADNAAYIAAADPTTVLDLLDRLEAAEAQRDEAIGRIGGEAG